MSEFVANPLLQKSVRTALNRILEHRPELKLKVITEQTEHGLMVFTDFCAAVRNVEYSAIVEAGQRWVVQSKWSPEPSEFADLARAIEAEKRAPRAVPSGPLPSAPPATHPCAQRFEDLAERSKRGGLTTLRQQAEVWSLAEAECETPEQAAKLRQGIISIELWDQYVTRVAMGEVSPAGPARGTTSRAVQRRAS